MPGAHALEHYFGLGGKVALITGAAGGIGRAMLRVFADAGASLVATDHENALLTEVIDSLGIPATRVLGVACDLRSETDVGALVDAAIGRFGRIDVLLANAGISTSGGSSSAITDADWDAAFAINLRAASRLSGLIAPLMANQGGGSMVFTSSIAGLRGNLRLGLYGLTKAALAQLARNVAVEFGPLGVRANALAPGLINTSWAASILSNPEAAARRLGATPLRRVGEPWEVATAALFLASRAGGYVTGQTLVVDGGTLISDGN